MAPFHSSRINSYSLAKVIDQAQDQSSPCDLTQGATCQPLGNAPTLQLQYYQHQQPHHTPGAFVALSPAMQITQSPPPLAFDSSPDKEYTAMEGFELDYDILNNLNYLESLNFADYNDFDLLPAAESLIQPPFTDASFFPSLDKYDTPTGETTTPVQRVFCQHGDCIQSFSRPSELTRHEYKHTRPFKCPHCGRAFAEKRRCVQHIRSVHDLATDKDKTKCHMCKYAHVRPDAVKRHLRLKHRIGSKSDSQSDQSAASSRRRTGRQGGGKGRIGA